MKTTLLRACSAVAVVLAAVSPLRAGGDAVAAPRAVASCRTGGITIPRVLSFQGKLTDTVGLPVADTLHVVRFKLYAQPTGGTHFWEEIQSVTTRKGQFSVLLGLLRPLGSLPESGGAYLGMAVGGGPEMTPRLRLASAAYAYLSERAGTAEQLQGKDTAALDRRYVNEAQAGAVTGVMIADGAIGAKDLGQMGASIGQVMKWTGSAWAARNDSASRGFDSTAFHHNDTTDEGQIGGEKHLFATAAHFRHKTPEDPPYTTKLDIMTGHKSPFVWWNVSDTEEIRMKGDYGWLEYRPGFAHPRQRTYLYWDGGENLDTTRRQNGDTLRNPARRAYWGYAWCDRSLQRVPGFAMIAQYESSQARIMADTLEQAEMVLLGSHAGKWSDTTSATAAAGFYTDKSLTARGTFTLGNVTIDSISRTPAKDTMFFWCEGRRYILPARGY